MNSIIQLEQVTKTYRSRGVETHALNGVNIDLHEGEFISIMGPSGSGKTTLLNMLATIDQPTSGKIYFKNNDLTKMKIKTLSDYRSKHIGFLFQEYNLLEHLKGFDNIALPLTFENIPHKLIKQRVEEVAAKLGVVEQLNKYPYEMSGGQKQRVATARAIIKEPTMLLADEPTGALDSASSKQLLSLLESLNANYGITILMVTHDPLSASYSKQVIFLKDGKEHAILNKGQSREVFYTKILDQLTYLGGE